LTLTEDGLRIVTCLLTVVLFGVTAVGASFAEEAGAGAHDAGSVSNLPAEPGGSQPPSGGKDGDGAAKLDGPPQAHSKGDDARTRGGGEGTQHGLGPATNAAGASGLGDNGDHAIDTRIGMPSRRLDGNRSGIGNVKARARLLAPRRPSTPGTFKPGLRNAIGVPVAPHGGLERGEGEHHAVPSGVSNAPASGTAVSTTAEDRLERPAFVRPDTGSGLSPSTPNRGMISGTGTTHRGAGPQGIGGRAKTVAGISGTTIRSKH
jgi:hypothetical protein